MQHEEKSKGRNFQQNGKSPIQSWVIGAELKEEGKNVDVEENKREVEVVRRGRGILNEAWAMGEKALDAVAEHIVENENAENGFENDKSSVAGG